MNVTIRDEVLASGVPEPTVALIVAPASERAVTVQATPTGILFTEIPQRSLTSCDDGV